MLSRAGAIGPFGATMRSRIVFRDRVSMLTENQTTIGFNEPTVVRNDHSKPAEFGKSVDVDTGDDKTA